MTIKNTKPSEIIKTTTDAYNKAKELIAEKQFRSYPQVFLVATAIGIHDEKTLLAAKKAEFTRYEFVGDTQAYNVFRQILKTKKIPYILLFV